MNNYVIKLLLYTDDLILKTKTTQDLKEHLKALELFFHQLGMQVNTAKTKVMIFTFKRKKVHREFIFEGSPL